MISVLIPTRGRPGFLREALESLRRQTFPRFEAVVVEDGEGEGLEVVAALGEAEYTLPVLEDVRGAGRFPVYYTEVWQE